MVIQVHFALFISLFMAPMAAKQGAHNRLNTRNASPLAAVKTAAIFWAAIGYQTFFAYLAGIVAYGIGRLFTGEGFNAVTAVACVIIIWFLYLLFRPQKNYRLQKTVSAISAQR